MASGGGEARCSTTAITWRSSRRRRRHAIQLLMCSAIGESTEKINRVSRGRGWLIRSRAGCCLRTGRSWRGGRGCGRSARGTIRWSCFGRGRGCLRRVGRRPERSPVAMFRPRSGEPVLQAADELGGRLDGGVGAAQGGEEARVDVVGGDLGAAEGERAGRAGVVGERAGEAEVGGDPRD